MIELHFEFKGERNYVQGGDIFNGIERVAKEMFSGGFVSLLVFRNLTRRHGILTFENQASMPLVATGNILSDNGQCQPFWLFEGGQEVTGRYAFDESSILASSDVVAGEKSIIMQLDGTVSPIEYVIALTKRLSYSIVPDIDGKWLFGQLNLDMPLTHCAAMRIVQKSILPGRMSINEIWLDNARVGTIRFIVGKP